MSYDKPPYFNMLVLMGPWRGSTHGSPGSEDPSQRSMGALELLHLASLGQIVCIYPPMTFGIRKISLVTQRTKHLSLE